MRYKEKSTYLLVESVNRRRNKVDVILAGGQKVRDIKMHELPLDVIENLVRGNVYKIDILRPVVRITNWELVIYMGNKKKVRYSNRIRVV